MPVQERVGVDFPALLSPPGWSTGKTPYDEVPGSCAHASIGNDKGAVIFEQRDVEVPADWSQTATNIVVSKYFYGKMARRSAKPASASWSPACVDTIAGWGAEQRYFKTPADAENFRLRTRRT